MKKYKLIKSTPFLGIGLLFTQMKENPDWYDTGNCWIKIHKNLIEGNAEYFELIEQKEFTETDMINFGRWAFNHLGIVVVENDIVMKEKISELRSKKCTN